MSKNHLAFFRFHPKHPLFFLFFACCMTGSPAQTTPFQLNDPDFQQLLENTAEQNQQENPEDTSWLDDLLYYSKHPIHLNDARKEELQALHLLTDIQIQNLLNHIEKNGDLIVVYELQAIDGFDLPVIQKLLPYIYVGDHLQAPALTKTELLKNGEHTILLRYSQVLEKQTGFRSIDSSGLYKNPNARYVGCPQKIFTRYQYTYGKTLSFGILAEKDPGESFLKHPQHASYPWYNQLLKGKQHNGFDFYSAHFFVQNIKQLRALAIGDYTLTFGQGLSVWSGMSLGKSSEILYSKKNAGGIRPSASADENRFMRGIASSLQFNKTTFTLFYSRKAVDANISDTLENGEPAAISSLQQTGIHSTPSEISDKHSVRETVYGSNITYARKKITLGVTFLNEQLSIPFQKNTSPYNQLVNHSRSCFHTGMDYNFIFHNFNFFGEIAANRNGGMAFLNGLFISLDPRLSFTVLHRYYQRNFENRFSAGFAESGTGNEKGVYVGISAHLTSTIRIAACYDRFEFPWLSYQADAPSQGNDLNLQLNYTPSKKMNVMIRIRQRYKQKNTTGETPMNAIISRNTTNYRLDMEYALTSVFKFRNRVEFLDYQLASASQTGYLLYQDIIYNKPGKPFSATFRYALFETDGYDSRLYAYENDVPGSYSIPACYDRGARFYVLFNYSFTKRIELWLRYARTIYDNKKVISEGTLSEIQGNTKSEIKLQMKLKL